MPRSVKHCALAILSIHGTVLRVSSRTAGIGDSTVDINGGCAFCVIMRSRRACEARNGSHFKRVFRACFNNNVDLAATGGEARHMWIEMRNAVPAGQLLLRSNSETAADHARLTKTTRLASVSFSESCHFFLSRYSLNTQ